MFFRAKLALEYQGKATKLRQQVFGDQHTVTINSLDYFTVIYAEVGKQQYTGRMPSEAITKNKEFFSIHKLGIHNMGVCDVNIKNAWPKSALCNC